MTNIASGTITEIGGFPITNTMVAAVLTSATLIIIAVLVRKKLSERPGKLQAFFELVYSYIYDLCLTISDKKRADKFLPWILTFFLFILISNYWGLVPIFGEGIVIKEEAKNESSVEEVSTKNEELVKEVHAENENAEAETEIKVDENEETKEEHHEFALLRGATSDTNTTFALSIVSFFFIVGSGLLTHNPIGLFKHYMQAGSLATMKGPIKFAMIPIFLFVAILEMILEPLKGASLSFRLFGNIFAGETLVTSMTIFNGVAIPIVAVPFLMLEVLVGVVQALVFSILTLVFVSQLTSKH